MQRTNMKFNQLLLIAIFAETQLASGLFAKAEAPADNKADVEHLKRQIQELDQKVRVLERQRENDQDDARATARSTLQVKLDSDGLTLSSADTNFVIGLHGLIQFDSRSFFDTSSGFKAGSDGFLLRKARPILTGTLFRDFDFNFTPDFGGSSPAIYDAYVNFH
jgi:phosphate-selective porin OprO/OprP